MKKAIKFVLTVAGAAMAQMLCAETVAWYHFDECEEGVVPTGGVAQFLNAMDSSGNTELAGEANALGINDISLTPGGVYRPSYTNVFPFGATWMDPASGVKGMNRRGLFFKTSWGSGGGHSSIVRVNDNEKLHLQRITVEMMVKYTGTKMPDLALTVAAMRNATGANYAWHMQVSKEGKLSVSLTGESGSTHNTAPADKNILDGNWHHIAFVYNGSTLYWYVDYTQVHAQSHTGGALKYSGSLEGKLCIGATDGANARRWHGFIDEVRISDKALSVDDFLRPCGYSEHGGEITDEDTAVYMSFDTAEIITDPFFGTVGMPMIYNESRATNNLAVKYVASADGILPSCETQNTVSNKLNGGMFSTGSFKNTGCWTFGKGNVDGRSIHMAIDDYSRNGGQHLISSGDFTIELWFKSDETPPSNRYLICEQAGENQAGTMLLYVDTSGKMRCRLVSQSELDDYEASGDGIVYNDSEYAGICDGKWHHVAFVVDRKNRFASFYVDHTLVKTHQNFILASQVPSGVTVKPLQISGGWGGGARPDQFYNMSIDELRITRRPLAPQEFLKAGDPGAEALEPVRMYLGFDGDYSASPRAEEMLLKTTVGGNAPVFSTKTPGNKIVDGLGNVFKEDNTNSISFASTGGGGRIHYSRNVLLERDMHEQTVEFFMRAPKDSAIAWAHLLHLGIGENAGGINVWSIGYCSLADDGLAVRVDTDLGGMANGEPGFNQVTYAKNVSPDDGMWHHIAVTFALHEETNTQVRIYKDYSLVGEKVIDGRLKMSQVPTTLNVAMAENGNYYYKGLIDEVRISKGVLPVERMLKALKTRWEPFRLIVR